jgi:hypothetical protein
VHIHTVLIAVPDWLSPTSSYFVGHQPWDPGTAEEAVRREVLEEAGLAVGPVAIVGSQPWPIGGLPLIAMQHRPCSLLTAV